jgi:hypothetical protein
MATRLADRPLRGEGGFSDCGIGVSKVGECLQLGVRTETSLAELPASAHLAVVDAQPEFERHLIDVAAFHRRQCMGESFARFDMGREEGSSLLAPGLLSRVRLRKTTVPSGIDIVPRHHVQHTYCMHA